MKDVAQCKSREAKLEAELEVTQNSLELQIQQAEKAVALQLEKHFKERESELLKRQKMVEALTKELLEFSSDLTMKKEDSLTSKNILHMPLLHLMLQNYRQVKPLWSNSWLKPSLVMITKKREIMTKGESSTQAQSKPAQPTLPLALPSIELATQSEPEPSSSKLALVKGKNKVQPKKPSSKEEEQEKAKAA